MAQEEPDPRSEALAWQVRLSQLSITTDRLWSFSAWRQDPLNAAAWDALEDETRRHAEQIR